MTKRPAIACAVYVVALCVLAAGGSSMSVAQNGSGPAVRGHGVWTEVKWPFPMDQWGLGRAFTCRAADCASDVSLYLRPKLGFCNCSTGVSDDAELDRVGDVELLSPTFNGLTGGKPIAVGWMTGRSRPYHVSVPYSAARTAIAIAFNDKCDVMVSTVVAEREALAGAEQSALEFLNGDLVLRWTEKEFGL
jgi:hypothetical protein